MKISKYTLSSDLGNEEISLFSTITRALVKLDKDKYGALTLDKVDESFFTSSELDFLRNKNFVVQDDLNESNFLNIELNRDRLSPEVFSTYIALSTLCNFSCVYCYEQGQISEHEKMDDKTLQATLDWYKNILTNKNYKKCKIILYGGEPLLYQDLLKKFINGIKKICTEMEVSLSFNMITNGYLFDKKICEYLIENDLEEVQITLDGCELAHDKRRMLKSGKGTFSKIIENIINTVETNLKIVIRVSFDSDNISEIKDLLKYLNKISLNQRILLYFAPIHQTTTQTLNSCSFCSQHIYSDYQVIAKTYCSLYSEAYKLNFKIPTCYTNGPCMLVASDACLIAPNGDLYKCVEMIGKKDLCIGSVFDNNYNNEYYNFMIARQMGACIESGCIYTPICGGGCIMESYMKNGDTDNISCHKMIFSIVTEHLNQLKCN